MKKIVLILLALILTFGMTACGGGTDNGDALKVGFIYIGSAQDGGFTQAHDEGRLAMEKHFDGKVETSYVEEVDDTNAQDIKNAAMSLMDKGCTVIIGTSYGFMDTLAELAEDYPDNYFLHFSGNKANDTNFDNFFGAIEEPRYLSGMAAGKMTKTNKLGYVAAFPYTEVKIGINAFALGAQSVNKDVVVKVVYINSWYDPAKEKEAAEALLAQKCDVVTQHCDTTGPIEAAKKAKAYSIGYNLDKGKTFPDTLITTPIWNHGVYYTEVIQEILDGKFKPQSYYGNMKDGYVDIAPFNDFVPEDVQQLVNDARDKIIAGELAPFQGVVTFADGKTSGEEGKIWTRAEIWEMDQVVKGVEAKE